MGMSGQIKKSDHANKHLQDLRGTLDWLRARGDLIETTKQVDPDLEVTGLQKLMDGGCPVVFDNVKGKPKHQVLTNLFGDIKVVNAMFGWADDKDRTRKLARALSKPLPPVGDLAIGSAVPAGRHRECRTTSTNISCRSATPRWRRSSPSARASAACPARSSATAPTSATTA